MAPKKRVDKTPAQMLECRQLILDEWKNKSTASRAASNINANKTKSFKQQVNLRDVETWYSKFDSGDFSLTAVGDPVIPIELYNIESDVYVNDDLEMELDEERPEAVEEGLWSCVFLLKFDPKNPILPPTSGYQTFIATYAKDQVEDEQKTVKGYADKFSNCIHCGTDIPCWKGSKYDFNSRAVFDHLEKCEQESGEEALQRYKNFIACGSRDILILWPDEEVDEKEFYKIECPRCSQIWIEISCPGRSNLGLKFRVHFSTECQAIKDAKNRINSSDKLDYKVNHRYKLPKAFEHRINSGHQLNCFYKFRLKNPALVYSFHSFLDTTTYRGHSNSDIGTDSYGQKYSQHKKCFDANQCQSVPLLFAENQKDTALIEAISIVTRNKNTNDKNANLEILPLINASNYEFETAVQSLCAAERHYYEYVVNKLGEEQFVLNGQSAKESAFLNVQSLYLELPDIENDQVSELANQGMLLSQELKEALSSEQLDQIVQIVGRAGFQTPY